MVYRPEDDYMLTYDRQSMDNPPTNEWGPGSNGPRRAADGWCRSDRNSHSITRPPVDAESTPRGRVSTTVEAG